MSTTQVYRPQEWPRCRQKSIESGRVIQWVCMSMWLECANDGRSSDSYRVWNEQPRVISHRADSELCIRVTHALQLYVPKYIWTGKNAMNYPCNSTNLLVEWGIQDLGTSYYTNSLCIFFLQMCVSHGQCCHLKSWFDPRPYTWECKRIAYKRLRTKFKRVPPNKSQ